MQSKNVWKVSYIYGQLIKTLNIKDRNIKEVTQAFALIQITTVLIGWGRRQRKNYKDKKIIMISSCFKKTKTKILSVHKS